MVPTNRREREKTELRTRILDAARELILELGVQAVTMRRIAERIEYSATALYFHFKDKDALLRDLCNHDFQAFASHFHKAVSVADPVERIEAAGRAYLEFALTHPSQYTLMFITPLPVGNDDPEVMARKGVPEQDAYAFLKIIVQDAISQGRLLPHHNDPDMVAQMLWAAVHGVASLHIAHSQNNWVDWRPIQDRIEITLKTITFGLTGKPSATPSRKRSRP